MAASYNIAESTKSSFMKAQKAREIEAERALCKVQTELAEMAARDVPLSAALDELNGALYSETGQQWQGEALWQAIRSLPALEAQQPATIEASALPPLYPR